MSAGRQQGDRGVELLYFSRGDTLAKRQHEHPFYQLEICITGELHGRSGEHWVCIRPGHFWLIPPETEHCFVRAATGTEFYSLKFQSPLQVPAAEALDDVTKYHVEAIERLLERGHVPSPHAAAGKEIVEAHLLAMLRHLEIYEDVDENQENEFIMHLREIVSIDGYLANVKELTNELKCTRAQLKYKFTKASGGEKSLKAFISQILLEMAINHLRYSDRSFTQIASLMNFPELSLFSRFIKMNTGMSPGQLRKKLRGEVVL